MRRLALITMPKAHEKTCEQQPQLRIVSRLKMAGSMKTMCKDLPGSCAARQVSKAVLLAQDCRYDSNGKPDLENTSFFVPNWYLLQVCGDSLNYSFLAFQLTRKKTGCHRRTGTMGRARSEGPEDTPSHSERRSGGASLSSCLSRVLTRGVIVIVHTAAEQSVLRAAATCHCSQRWLYCRGRSFGHECVLRQRRLFPQLVDLVKRFPNLYCDTAVLGDKFRWRNLARLMDADDVLRRTIYGSDTPFPSNPLVFWNRLKPAELWSLLSEENLFERNYRLQHSLGLRRQVFERGARLLSLAGIGVKRA
jgi:hypothetical protein